MICYATRRCHNIIIYFQRILTQDKCSYFFEKGIETRDFSSKFPNSYRCKPVKLAYKLFEPKLGSDDRLSPLLFLHGICQSKEVAWGDLPQTFADRTKRKAYSLDARNHGDSDWSDEFDLDLTAGDLLHFMDEMSFPKAVIIGHSMGGMTGIKAALKLPGRIEMLFVEEMFVKKMTHAHMELGLSYMHIWREAEKFIPSEMDEKNVDNFIKEYVLRKIYPQNYLQESCQHRYAFSSHPLNKDSSGRYVFKANLAVLIENVKNAESLMAENEGIYENPSYFLYGTKSPYQVGKEKHHILKHFPKAVFVPFETSFHLVHQKFPDLFVETVVKFIKQCEIIQ